MCPTGAITFFSPPYSITEIVSNCRHRGGWNEDGFFIFGGESDRDFCDPECYVLRYFGRPRLASRRRYTVVMSWSFGWTPDLLGSQDIEGRVVLEGC